MTARLTPDGRPPAHEVHIEDGRFAHAVCTCGWRSAGRRDRRVVRQEALDHVTLFAGLVHPVGRAETTLRQESAEPTGV